MSMGASVVSAYLHDYGTKGRVDKVVSIVGAWEGSNVIADLIDLAYAEAKDLCYPYTKVPPIAPAGRDFNDISDKPRYVITLYMPPTTAKSTPEVVRERINEYFIWKVMEDWLAINAPEMAKDYAGKAESIGEEIQRVLTSRMRMTTIKPSVF